MPFFKIQYECVSCPLLSKILAQSFITVVNWVSQLCPFLKHVAYRTGVYIHQDESWSLSFSGEWTSWNWPGRVVRIKSNVFFSRVGKCTICSKPWSFIMPINPPSLIRVFAVRSMDKKGPKLFSCGQGRLWSDWADAQADLSLHWPHMPFCWFCHAATQTYFSKETNNLCI